MLQVKQFSSTFRRSTRRKCFFRGGRNYKLNLVEMLYTRARTTTSSCSSQHETSVPSLQAVFLSLRYPENCGPSTKFRQRMFNWCRSAKHTTKLKLNSLRSTKTPIASQESWYFPESIRKKCKNTIAMDLTFLVENLSWNLLLDNESSVSNSRISIEEVNNEIIWNISCLS